MVSDVSVMTTLFQVIIVFLLLLITTFAVPKLHPLLYTTMFFILLFIVLTTVIFPFVSTFVTLFEAFPNPFVSLLIGSAILFFVSEIIADHLAEAGYESLAKVGHFAVKITILLLWMEEISAIIEQLSVFIKR